MQTRSLATALCSCLLALVASDAAACGESMFHSGQAMRYHAFISRQPADILVYDPGSDVAATTHKRIWVGLEKAGHKVTVVNDSAALASALAARHYDVIIAGGREMNAITALIGTPSRDTALLAVLDPAAAKDANAQQRYTHSLREDDGLNQYLKSIEQTMQTRGS